MNATAVPEAEDIQCIGYRADCVVVVFKNGDGVPLAQASLDFEGARDLAASLIELVTKLEDMGPSSACDPIVGHASAPLQLTSWKISAIKIAATLEKRGFVTRGDFKHYGIDYRRWIAADSGWLKVSDGRYVRGARMPDFKSQHPKVYEEIAAAAAKWMPPAGVLPLSTGALL